MFKAISGKLKEWQKTGIPFFYAFDGSTGLPSITLLFAYVTFILAVCSTIALHFKTDLVVATSTSIVFWLLAFIFYRLRKLDKVKFNFAEKSFELDSEETETPLKKEE